MRDKVGTFDTELVREWFQAFAMNSGMTLHVATLYGSNDHHIAESCFKGLARALRAAVAIDHALPTKFRRPRDRWAAEDVEPTEACEQQIECAIYTVHEPPLKPDESAPDPDRFVFVRDGFSFWAFLLAPLWMLRHRLWLVLLGYLIIVASRCRSA